MNKYDADTQWAAPRIMGGHITECDTGGGMPVACDRCAEWRAGVRVGPVLENARGFACCPKCHASYGDWSDYLELRAAHQPTS